MKNLTTKAWALALGMNLLISGTALLPVQAAGRVYHTGTTYTRQMREADYSLQTGQYELAEKKYMSLLRRNPRNLHVRSALSLAQAELFKLGAAEKNANQVLERDPRNAMAHMAKGVVYRNRTASHDLTYRNSRDELLEKSMRELQQAVQYDPRSPEAHNQLGVTYRFMDRNAKAQAEFAKALELDPRFAEALLNAGILQLGDGDVAGAKDRFNRAIKLNSKNHMAHYRLGEALLAEGDTHQALQALNTALSLDRGNAAVLAKMGEAYEAQGNSSAAIASFRKAIQSNPSYMPAYMGISDVFDRRGDGELAMAELRSALNVNPHWAEGRNRLGRIALAVDKPDQALQYYKQTLREDPSDAEAINGLSQALTVIAQKQANWSQTVGADSDLVNAEQTLGEALRMNPNDLRLHLAHLRISRLTGKPSASEAELNAIVTQVPRNQTEAMLQGEAFLALGRYPEADRVFGDLMRQSVNDADQLLVIGDTLKVNGDLDRARDAYEMALTAEPGNLKAQRGIDRIEKAQAEAQKTLRLANSLNNWFQKTSALDFYEETLAKNPRQPEARLELSKLYEKTKQYEKAALSYQFYLSLAPDLSEKDRERYLKRIAKLQEKALEKSREAESETH